MVRYCKDLNTATHILSESKRFVVLGYLYEVEL
jgi:hypothetical protein